MPSPNKKVTRMLMVKEMDGRLQVKEVKRWMLCLTVVTLQVQTKK